MAARVFVDFETTGLSIYHDQIFQIGAVCDVAHIEPYARYVLTTKQISKGSAKVTGVSKVEEKRIIKYTETDISDLTEKEQKQFITQLTVPALPSKEALLDFLQWLKSIPGPLILVAYNGLAFDFPMFYSELHRHNLQPLQELTKCQVRFLLDPFVWAKQHLDRNLLKRDAAGQPCFRQPDIYACLLTKELEGAHDALCDVRALHEICDHAACSEMNTDTSQKYCVLLETFIDEFGQRRHSVDHTIRSNIKRKVENIPSVLSFFARTRSKKAKVIPMEEKENGDGSTSRQCAHAGHSSVAADEKCQKGRQQAEPTDERTT